MEAGWIEIYNPGPFDANLKDYTLAMANRGSTIKAGAALPDVIAAAEAAGLAELAVSTVRPGEGGGMPSAEQTAAVVYQVIIHCAEHIDIYLRKFDVFQSAHPLISLIEP